MSSIVLEPGVKDMLLADCKDFLHSEEWYADRGIPFRRGYLLHGVPGSGKTSLIHSLAGELGLDIYVVSLSSKGMSDNTLTTLMGLVPSRCILLLEDLDAAFTRGVSRDESSTGAPAATAANSPASKNATENTTNDGSTLSLSGLLNSLDGVAAAEGRLLFATTNHIERLDPALSRPGRMDVWVNFKNATRWQAEGIFKNFFPCKPAVSATPPATAESPATTTTTTDTPSTPSEDESERETGIPQRRTNLVPMLEEHELCELAKRFADAIPEDELSVAALQGYLLKNKTRPCEAVEEVAAWVIQERETRAKLKKEKEEREAKEKKEAEEKEKKEKEELEAKEKAEKELKEKEEKAKEKAEKKEAKEAAKAKSRRKRASLEAARSAAADTTRSQAAQTESADAAAKTDEDSTTSETSSSSSSLSESDSSNGGVEADTEDSITSEEEKTSSPTLTKEKWVSVKGQPQQQPPSLSLDTTSLEPPSPVSSS